MHRLGPELLVKELPPRSESTIYFRLSDDQEAMYQSFIQVTPPPLFPAHPRLGTELLVRKLPPSSDFTLFLCLSADQEAIYQNLIDVRSADLKGRGTGSEPHKQHCLLVPDPLP